MLLIPNVRVGTCYLLQDCLTLRHSWWPICSFDPTTSPSGHLRSCEVIFLSLTFNRIKIERRGLFHHVSLALTHRLICNILGCPLTSRDRGLRSDFEMDLSRLTCIYFDLFRRQEHGAALIMVVTKFPCSNVICAKHVMPKTAILAFFDLYSLTVWS